jgi:hypothetical protein
LDDIKIGYKVVSVIGDGVYAPATLMAYQNIRYIENKTIKSDIKSYGDFCVYDKLEEAKYCLDHIFDYKGFKEKDRVPMALFKIEYIKSSSETLWFRRNGKTIQCKLRECPKGTVLASELKLVEKIMEV